MHNDVFAEAARLAALQNDSLNAARVTAITNLDEFLHAHHRHVLTTFLRLARQYVVLLETNPLLVGVSHTYILSGNGIGGLGCLDKNLSETQSGSITQHLRMPGLRTATASELVDMFIAHGEDPSNIVARIHTEINAIATRMVRAANP